MTHNDDDKSDACIWGSLVNLVEPVGPGVVMASGSRL